MRIEPMFHEETSTLTYVVFDEHTLDAVVIDPVLDYDPLTVSTSTTALDKLLSFVKRQRLLLRGVLETHAHADHLSGAAVLKERLGVPVVIGAGIVEVQAVFAEFFALPASFAKDGSQFDRLVQHGERSSFGSLVVEAIATPGHTPACITWRIGDTIFTGDSLFMPDAGTGRCDFPRGSAAELWESIQRLYRLPDDTRVFVGHDYQPNDRALHMETTIQQSKEENIQLRATTTKEDFVRFRTTRDRQLSPPRLLFPSVQVNIDGGRLPPPEPNGQRLLRLPLNALKD